MDKFIKSIQLFLININRNIDAFLEQLSNNETVIAFGGYLTVKTFNIALILFMLIIGYLLFKHTVNVRGYQKLYRKSEEPQYLKDEGEDKVPFFERYKYFKTLQATIDKKYLFENQVKKEVFLFYLILMLEFILIASSIYLNKAFIGISLTLVIHVVIIKVIRISTTDMDDVVRDNLPILIKHFIKVLSKTNDLKTVIYEVSKHIDEPIKGRLIKLSRRMLSEDDVTCLNDFADEIDSIWMYAFVFLVISLKEHSSKEVVVNNLKELSRIIEEENRIIKKDLIEKKPMVLMNYAIMLLAIVGGVMNIMFNEIAVEFFFNSINGMIVFVLGVSLILGTFVVNTVLIKKAEGR